MAGHATSTLEPFFGECDAPAAQWFLGYQVRRRLAAAQTGGVFSLIEQIVPPGLGSPYHVHRHEDETFYLLEGEIRFFSDGRTWVLRPGGVAFLPRGVPHGFRTEGDVPSRSLLFAIGSGMEDVVAELGSPEPPTDPPDMGLLMMTAARYGIDLLGLLPD